MNFQCKWLENWKRAKNERKKWAKNEWNQLSTKWWENWNSKIEFSAVKFVGKMSWLTESLVKNTLWCVNSNEKIRNNFCLQKMQNEWSSKSKIWTDWLRFCSLDSGLCCFGNLLRGADSLNGAHWWWWVRSVFELLLSLANSKCFGQKSNCSSSWQNSNWWKTNFQIKYWTDWLNFESANTLWWVFRQLLNCCWVWQIRNAA